MQRREPRRAGASFAPRDRLAPYERAHPLRSLWQLVHTLGAFLLLWYFMVRSLDVSYGLTLALAIPAAGFLVRLFIIQHDCGHGSFFGSRRANDVVGRLCSVLTLTPYRYWQRFHALHHATSSKLDHRSEYDIPTLTVSEYLALSRWGRLRYRLYRHPIVLFGLGPLVHFAVRQRLPWIAPRSWRAERRSIVWTSVAILAAAAAAAWAVGGRAFIQVQMPITWIASTAGLWLFYVQHQFEETYWANDPEWSFELAGLRGASYYRLPALLRWFTGSIGFHHIHHLSTRIPNYRLRRCFEENPALREVASITLRASLRCLSANLWDERRQRMVRFREAIAPARASAG